MTLVNLLGCPGFSCGGPLADIFISYARPDRAKIESLAAALEAEGYSVWWDRRIQSGSEFSTEIENELSAAKAVIVCWSEHANTSRWVKDEANAGAEAGKLLSITLDGKMPPIGFRQFHCADLSTWRGKSDDKIFQEFDAAVRGRVLGDTVAAAPVSSGAPNKAAYAINPAVPIVAIVAAAIVAIVWFGVSRNNSESAPKASAPPAVQQALDEAAIEKTLAVLPFKDLSPNGDQEYFADGLSEEIMNALVRLPELKVTGRTSAFSFKGVETSITDIASILQVNYVLEGSVRRDGDRLRITAQLVRASDGFSLWSESYDGTLTDIFTVQEAIGENVVTSLDIVLDEAKRTEMFAFGTRNAIAFDYFQKARAIQAEWHISSTGPEIWEANELFQNALDNDPEFAKVYFHMADPYAHYFFGQIPLPSSQTEEEARNKMEYLLRKSVETATDDQIRAQHKLNRIFLTGDWRRLGSVVSEFKRAFEGSTRPYDPIWEPEILVMSGEFEFLEALAERQMISVDPLNSGGYNILARSQFAQNKFSDAKATLTRGREVTGNSAVGDELLMIEIIAGAEADFKEWVAENPEPISPVVKPYFETYKRFYAEGKEAARNYVINASTSEISYLQKTALLTRLGHQQEALDILKSVEDDPILVAGHAIVAAHADYCGLGVLPLTDGLGQKFREAKFKLPPCIGETVR